MGRVSDFMAWLGGGDREIMAGVPRSRGRFIQMAGVLLTTSGIAVLSMIFALHNGIKVALFPALVLGLLWGVVIINLDRFLVVSMEVGRSRWNVLLMALPRLALAAVLSLVISTPMVLRIFASDIDNQIRITQLENSAKEGQLEQHSKEVQQYNLALRKIDTDKSILAGNIPAAPYTPLQTDMANIDRLTAIVQQDRQAELSARLAWQCELQGQSGAGCPSTSGRAGNGARATTDQQAYEAALAIYNQAYEQLQPWLTKEKQDQAAANSAQASSLATDQRLAGQDLLTETALVNKLRPEIQNIQTQDTASNEANTGILAQVQALSDASAQNPSLNAARLLVTLLFFLIEILPVSVKVLLSLAPPTAYDLAVKMKDEQTLDEKRQSQVESQRIAELESDSRIRVAADRVAKKEGLDMQANTRVASEIGKIVDARLDEWSKEAQAKAHGGGGAQAANGSARPANGATVAANGATTAVNGRGPSVNGGTPTASSNGYPVGAHSQDLLSPGFQLPDSDDL